MMPFRISRIILIYFRRQNEGKLGNFGIWNNSQVVEVFHPIEFWGGGTFCLNIGCWMVQLITMSVICTPLTVPFINHVHPNHIKEKLILA